MRSVRTLYTAMMVRLTEATDRELARMVSYLKEENRILRAQLPEHINTTPRERERLLRFGRHLGKAIHRVVTIMTPGTFLCWLREERKAKPRRRARLRTADDLKKLILRMARENDWGYTRIMGELQKLAIVPPSRNTVKKILKQAGLEPGPKRGAGTWDEFLNRHAATLVQCDFLNKRIWTAKGLWDVFVLVFLHGGTQRAFVTPVTTNPTEAWGRKKTECYLRHAKRAKLPVQMLFHDRDSEFTAAVDADLARADIQVIETAFKAPNTNAYVERFIQTIQQECLDRFVVFGTQHLDHLGAEYLGHYHEERPHQSLENEPLMKPKKRVRPSSKRGKIEDQIVRLADVRCSRRLGGLKSYSRKAA